MATQTKISSTIALELPPEGGSLSPISTLEEDAHYLRVTLDKSENMKAAAGQRLAEMLQTKFSGNRNALRDWYEAEVVDGKAHRAWATVEQYLVVVLKYGDRANEEFERRKKLDTDTHRTRRAAGSALLNEINDLAGTSTIRDLPPRQPKSEYEQRSQWLGNMDYVWFKGKPEWQDKWLEKHGFRK